MDKIRFVENSKSHSGSTFKLQIYFEPKIYLIDNSLLLKRTILGIIVFSDTYI